MCRGFWGRRWSKGLAGAIVKAIRLSAHAREQAEFRGALEHETANAITSESWQAAANGRFECAMDFPFGSVWNGRGYQTKRVRPIFVEEATQIVVVTVYVYYF